MRRVVDSGVAPKDEGTSAAKSTGMPLADVGGLGHLHGMTQDSLVVSVTEAAALLGISRRLAYELARTGELPAVRLGRCLVVPRHAPSLLA
jgi:excisionase family DNA binding protein